MKIKIRKMIRSMMRSKSRTGSGRLLVNPSLTLSLALNPLHNLNLHLNPFLDLLRERTFGHKTQASQERQLLARVYLPAGSITL